MAKSSKDQIEQDEKKLLSELMKNAKENIDAIAKHCGFSRQKASRMINRLEKSKKIWGYSAIIDAEKQGLQKFMLYLKRTQQEFEKKDLEDIVKDRFDKTLLNLGINVESSYYINGEYDWVIIFTAKDIRQAKKFCDTLLINYPGITTLGQN